MQTQNQILCVKSGVSAIAMVRHLSYDHTLAPHQW